MKLEVGTKLKVMNAYLSQPAKVVEITDSIIVIQGELGRQIILTFDRPEAKFKIGQIIVHTEASERTDYTASSFYKIKHQKWSGEEWQYQFDGYENYFPERCYRSQTEEEKG